MYRILQEEGIELPRYAVLNRDPDKPDGQSNSQILKPWAATHNEAVIANLRASKKLCFPAVGCEGNEMMLVFN